MKLSKKELERDRQLARGNGFQFKVTAPPQKPHGRVKPEFYFRTEAAAQIWIRTELKGKGTLTLDGGGRETEQQRRPSLVTALLRGCRSKPVAANSKPKQFQRKDRYN
jgi:hypothetical protein